MTLKKQINSLPSLFLPIRWGVFSLTLLSNVFPLATVFYLMVSGTPSIPWITRTLFVVLLITWAKETATHPILKMKAAPLDLLMAIFFCFALIGYVRSDYPNHTFEYFLVLNLAAFFMGRFTRAERCDSLVAYFFGFALLIALACIIALPEIYHQWEVAGAKHPILYDVVATAGGLDVTLGYLPVLAGVLVLFAKSKVLNHVLHSCIALSVALLILIASKSVILAVTLTLVIIMTVRYRNWRRSVPILATLLISSLVAVAIAPTNNLKFYGLSSISNWVSTLMSNDAHEIVIDTNNPDTGVTRIKLATAAIQQIVNDPLLGTGTKDWDYLSSHPHNILLESALTFGIPSFFALTLFYVMSIWRLTFMQTETAESEQVKYVSVAALLLFLLLCNLVQGQLASFRSLPLFLLSGYASAMIAQQRQVTTGNTIGNKEACR